MIMEKHRYRGNPRSSTFVLALLPLLYLTCGGLNSGSVRLTNDSYKQVKLFSLTLNVIPEEPGPIGNDRTAKLEFFRVQSSPDATSILTLTLKVDESDQDIRDEIYFKIDEQPHKVNLTNFVQHSVTQTVPHATNIYGTNMGPNTTLSTVRSKIFKGRLEFTQELEAALKKCKTVAMRAYMGGDALNLKFSSSESNAIRKFFAGIPDETVNN